MKKQSSSKKTTSTGSYASSSNIPSMATPRKPESPNRVGILGAVLMLGVIGGLIWLAMLVLGIGPYHVEGPTLTPSPTETQTPSRTVSTTAAATSTVTVTNTITPTTTNTLTPSPTPELLPFILAGEPETMSSEMIPQQQLGCDWLVIAGQVWDLGDEPVTGLTLHLFGELGGYTIDRFVLSGSALAYGESGYQFALQNLVVDSQESLFIQLVDTNGIPLSRPYAIQTYEDCGKNLILINFKQVR
jgi:hypothetical protein